MAAELGPEIQIKKYQVSMADGLIRIIVIGEDGAEILRMRMACGDAVLLAEAIKMVVFKQG